MNTSALRIFIGYDSRERDAYEVCKQSLIDKSESPLCIQPLDETKLRHAGLYNRYWHVESGQKFDNCDNKPFSTAFSFTRFLVPTLCQWQGMALYCDCDFLWRADVWALLRDIKSADAISVVKHNHNPLIDVKMEGQLQTQYYRKNWSSLIMYNCGHPANYMLTPSVVNSATGQWLHGLSWVYDFEIGDLDRIWNCLVGIDKDIEDPFAVHFTDGTPSMRGHENDPYADEWWKVRKRCI
jgi:hypothetical protein